jgi:thiamine biosynthesis lipoprotein
MRVVEHIMGIPITMDIPDCDDALIFEKVFKRFREIDKRFSPYKTDSELSKFQRGEITSSNLSEEFKKIMAACKEAQNETDGYFSAFYSMPSPSHLDAVQGAGEERPQMYVKYDEDVPEPSNAAMRQEPAGISGFAGKHGKVVRRAWYDPTGYVKGWAIAEAGKIIEKNGRRTYCISAGGDVLARSMSDKIWNVGIQDPHHKHKIIGKISDRNFAVATSGNYERGAHVINPKTGEAAQELLSVTVTGPDIIRADVLATAIFAGGKSGLILAEEINDYETLVIDNSEGFSVSSGMVAILNAGIS